MVKTIGIVDVSWGDNGKGAVVLEYAKNADANVRAQGGNNAGHTLYDSNGRKKVVNIAPSSVVLDGVVSVIGNGTVIDYEVLDKNLEGLNPNLKISAGAHIILDYHKALDAAIENAKGDRKIGTTKKGIGPAYADKINRIGIRSGILNQRYSVLEETIHRNVELKNRELEFWKSDERIDAYKMLTRLMPIFKKYAPFVEDTAEYLDNLIRNENRVVFEGAQGTLLDIDHGSYPNVTSSVTTLPGLLAGSGLGKGAIEFVVGVGKVYTTRVGEGFLPTEGEHYNVIKKFTRETMPKLTYKEMAIVVAGDFNHPEYDKLTSRHIREVADEFGATTARPRRVGWLDLTTFRKAKRINGLDAIALTRLDNLDQIGTIKVAVGYKNRSNGIRDDKFPEDENNLEWMEPIYETFKGWLTSTRGIQRFEDLPIQAKDFIFGVADLSELDLTMVRTGPRQGDKIELIDPWKV
jgi:adenylosuccinate synthase